VTVNAAILQRFRVGDRVRADLDLFFADTGVEVAAGTLGRVRAVDVSGCAALVRVEFDGVAACTTSVDNLRPAGD
jgi:hypothetical protein